MKTTPYLLSSGETEKFLQFIADKYGCYYCWPDKSNNYSGKDLAGATFKDTYDCSGLVTSGLYAATNGRIDRRATWNAHRIMKNCALVTTPEAGDLCFYGPSTGLITHVMVYIGKTQFRPAELSKDVRCYGSSGGNSTTLSPEIANQQNAKVTGYKSTKYRKDFQCYGRLVTNDD